VKYILPVHFSLYSYKHSRNNCLCSNLPCALWIVVDSRCYDFIWCTFELMKLLDISEVDHYDWMNCSLSSSSLCRRGTRQAHNWIDCCALSVCLFVACPVMILDLHDCTCLLVSFFLYYHFVFLFIPSKVFYHMVWIILHLVVLPTYYSRVLLINRVVWESIFWAGAQLHPSI
jgi:hypothetical protein